MRSLGTRFVAVLVLAFVAGLLAWGFVAAKSAGEEFSSHAEGFLEKNAADMKGVFDDEAAAKADLLDKAVRHLSENVASDFGDVPFDVFEGRDDLLLSYLETRLEAARRRNAENSRVISDQFRKRGEERLRASLAALEERRREESEAIERDIFRDMLIWGGTFLLGLSALVGVLFWATVLKPIRAATDVIEEVRAGESGRRIELSGAEEIDRLAKSFNAMADEIESYKRGASIKMEALETMARGMAHEFNNILGGIQGCSQDLLEDERDDDTREVLEVIVRTARRASVITDNLLRFSRGGQQDLSWAPLDRIIRDAVELVQTEADERGVTVEVSAAEGEPVLTDPRGLQQVALNLIINAVQASPSGGRVSVRATSGEDGAVILVSDDGVGIEAGVLPHVFDPFFTTKEAASSGRGGTGLGLSVSQGIVRSLGGTIDVRSDGAGRGATFTITLPVVEGASHG